MQPDSFSSVAFRKSHIYIHMCINYLTLSQLYYIQNTLKRHMFNKVLTNKFTISVIGSIIKGLAREITLIEIARLERSKLIQIEIMRVFLGRSADKSLGMRAGR